MTKINFKNQKKKSTALNFADFDAVKVTVASPDQIGAWSYGEVKKPETINYRTFKPEREGLFCDRIFGPTKDWECHCGKYKYIKHKGTVCDRCGVEVTESKVRRERFGHIDLAVPVAHLWFLRKPPSRIGILLNMKISDLEKVIYYTKYVVTADLKDRAGISSIVEKGMLLKEEEFDLIKYGISSPVVREEFKNSLDGVVAEEITLDADSAKALKQLKSLLKFQADHAGISADEAAKKIVANIGKGDRYFKCYFKSHSVYFYNDLDSSARSEIKKLLSENFEKGASFAITEPDRKIKLEFFDIEKENVFTALRKNSEGLKKFEGHLRIETARNEIPFMKDFAKPENSLLLEESDIKNINNGYGDNLKVDIGAAAVRKLLEEIKLDEEAVNIHAEIKKTKSDAERARLIRKLRVVEGFLNSGTRPEWMILTVLPVIPPDLRPLVALDGGRFATSDLNDLYRRIINRNNRLRHIEQLKAPAVMINNEKRLLQEAVDALIDNDSRTRPVTGAGNRPLKSLSDTLKGKQGRFRQNLLGKRVDYSGRSVIVVGPTLKLNQCGLPKEMALELFKPFIIKELINQENATLKSARRMLERSDARVWNILEKVTKNHPVLLNRAPTLHRLGIQAFEPVLVEGKSIQLHPLTCSAFNADFDGDQMAVHLPISLEAQLEAKVLMMATRNILSPASGKPIAVPSQDMVLGSFYLTKEKYGVAGEGKIFSSVDEVISAYQCKKVDLQARIKVVGLTNIRDEKLKDSEQSDVSKWKNYKSEDGKEVINYTTVGRVLFNEQMPKNEDGSYSLGYLNKVLGKKDLGALVDRCYKELGQYRTVVLLDEIKKLGYKYATMAGVSISIDEMKIPPRKEKLVKDAKAKIKEIEKQAKLGLITESERYNKIIDIWTKVTDEVADIMFDEMRKDDAEPLKAGENRFNSIYMMADSGARGSRQQVRQLAGMRGLMAKPQKKLSGGVGEIIETPIISNFREGLTVLEYFISTHGGRKGLSDTALKTAEAGYLTRRLIDVAHDVVVREADCKTVNGVFIGTLQSGDEVVEKIDERVVGRIALDNVVDIVHDELIVKRGELITPEKAQKLIDAGIDKIGIRSILTCEAEHGICAKCYGVNPATGKQVEVGEAVGIIAAQSIGEPGTQLTLRTFHVGGTASRVVSRSEIYAENNGTVDFYNIKTIKNKNGESVVLSRNAELVYTEYPVHRRNVYQIPYGAIVEVADGEKVEVKTDSATGTKKNVLLAKWDPHSKPIISEFEGTVHFEDIKDGVTLQKEKSKITGQIERVIIEHPADRKTPRIIIKKDNKTVAEYPLPVATTLVIHDGNKIKAGDVLAKIPQEVSKSRDITGGLPRVAELFEGRRPKNSAVVSEIDGVVHLGGVTAKGSIKVEVENAESKMTKDYLIPAGRHLVVYEGDRVKEGEALSDGAVNPHDILKVKGPKEVQEYLVNEIQQVYRLQGVTINDKHIEIIVRQMLSNVRIMDSGDSKYLNGEIISRAKYEVDKKAVKVKKGKAPVAHPILLGITKASLSSDSFISAASFQETTRILTEAAVSGQIDTLKGLKENVSIGHLIPAGTGLKERETVKDK
ncbi:DNA-directed RNA polymerase subunit beta' [Endomicrobium proavitum]|uniref:DNA-directed RNA polymerase subunit beta' n=1 Tax=Endomicrobium proavitum TaxID=1408281 RepID=A0A0G3WJ27_9BACT|nr:DNA-directed RNA polymerase subunit beta' [Endomicrobium proavitum]AKL98666.1 RNA polymerase, beta prime subunit [Endomicrobium proavitum]